MDITQKVASNNKGIVVGCTNFDHLCGKAHTDIRAARKTVIAARSVITIISLNHSEAVMKFIILAMLLTMLAATTGLAAMAAVQDVVIGDIDDLSRT